MTTETKIEADYIDREFRCVINLHTLSPSTYLKPWRCGYVGIPAGHPYFGVHYDKLDIDCHWGLTFSSKSAHDQVYPVESHQVWWVGFDCNHCDDGQGGDVPKSLDYVKEQCTQIVNQLIKVKNGLK